MRRVLEQLLGEVIKVAAVFAKIPMVNRMFLAWVLQHKTSGDVSSARWNGEKETTEERSWEARAPAVSIVPVRSSVTIPRMGVVM